MATIKHSLAWSAFGEIGAKLIGPISTMVLARLLTPEDFGVIAICNMILFFADIIVDSGFGKYLIQRDFTSKSELDTYASTAFWTTSFLSILVWCTIFIFRYPLANFLGKEDYTRVIVITSLQMVIVAIISPQINLLRRQFKYKQISWIRLTTSLIPLIVTIPLAFYLRTYWALVIGSFVGYIVQAILVSLFQTWKPRLYWSWGILKRMFGFSFWSMCEGLAYWFMFWTDTFILTKFFDTYYVGLYKNSSAIIMSLYTMVQSAIVPVLFSSLSRIHNSKKSYNVVLGLERLVQYLLIPVTIGIWFNRELITDLLLGSRWQEAATIVAYWGVIMLTNVTLYALPAEAFKAIGKPNLLLVYQLLYLVILIPSCYFAAQISFWTFVNIRLYCVVAQGILFVFCVRIFLKWSIKSFILNSLRPILYSSSIIVLNLLCPSSISPIVQLIGNGLLVLGIWIVNRKNILQLINSMGVDINSI